MLNYKIRETGETAFLKLQLIDINILEIIYLKVIDWAKEDRSWFLLSSLGRKLPLIWIPVIYIRLRKQIDLEFFKRKSYNKRLYLLRTCVQKTTYVW